MPWGKPFNITEIESSDTREISDFGKKPDSASSPNPTSEIRIPKSPLRRQSLFRGRLIAAEVVTQLQFWNLFTQLLFGLFRDQFNVSIKLQACTRRDQPA